MALGAPGSNSLDLGLFADHNLRHASGPKDAMSHLEQVLKNECSLNSVVEQLLSVHGLFPYIISVLDIENNIAPRILSEFPTSPDVFLCSVASKLLSDLSLFLFGLPPHVFSTETSRNIGRHRALVDGAQSVLRAILSLDFSVQKCVPLHERNEVAAPEEVDDFLIMKKSQRNRKKNRPKAQALATDLTPFSRLGLKVPLTAEEAQQMSANIMAEQEQILRSYFSILREPEYADVIRSMYLPEETVEVHDATHSASADSSTEAGEAPNAYPMVQPMKAALYFDNAEGFGDWTILIGSAADRKLREYRKADVKIFSIIVKKIKQLSNGHFSDDNQKRLNGPSSGVPVFEAKMTRDLRLVYQVDCIPDQDSETERQVIKVYGIYTHAQLDGRFWDAMGHQLSGKGKEYKRRCIFRNRPVNPGDNVVLPATFPPEIVEPESPVNKLDLREKDLHELHALLVLEKYVTFSQAFLNSIVADRDVTHVFHLTPQERKIVECTSSCYVLGRSGTGKTTTMLFKMLGIQRAWEMQADDMPKPRQIFVTKSRVLATKVEEYFAKLLESLALAGYSAKKLASLANKDSQTELVDLDDVPDWHSDIPRKYSLLEDRHFPLFVTFERLSNMIKADLDDLRTNSLDHDHQSNAHGSPENYEEEQAQDSFVSYDKFLNSYWPHFPQPLTKNLDPWLVFSEIIGIIKGSEQTLSSDMRFLDNSTYSELSHRTRSTFATQREIVYSIFELYCKLKRQNRHQDIADRTHTILKAVLSQHTLPGRTIDYLYVDEAQDNLLIDALLLRLLCKNPDGLFWAGDTAQTISAGSSFRFDDLKAFLYRVEHEGAFMAEGLRGIQQPQSFQLAVNYRSHGGIVNCAHSVIDLITRFWPNAIDSLAPEKGVVDGLKPIFFTGWDQDTVRYEQFLFGASGSHIEFGAQQCILVRDDGAREHLRQQVGDIGLIMTLYESKGLEFNDVLLYNFFEDSAFDLSQWRVVLNGVDPAHLVGLRAPSFERDEARYAGICGELKLLYVGITRARKNLWVVDRSEKCEPMRLFWNARNQVQICTPGTDVPHLAVSSTPEEWATFGRSLFQHKRYSQAMHCFERASLPREVAVAKAYQLREHARAMTGGATKTSQKAFLGVADAFAGCGAAAAGKERLQYYYNAADCYARGGDDRRAGAAYIEAHEYGLAAKRYRKAALFADTLQILKSHREKIPSDTFNELLDVCRLYYYSQEDVQPPTSLFDSFDEALEFLEDYDLDVARVTLLESHGRYSEAAELHLAENRPLDAIKSFMKDAESDLAMKRAAECLLDMLWRSLSFTVTSKTAIDSDLVETLRALAGRVKRRNLPPNVQTEISMFETIISEDLAELERLAEGFLDVHQRPEAALLCYEHVFSRALRIQAATAEQVATALRKFHSYIRLLYQFMSDVDPMSSPYTRKLLCISELSSNEYTIAPGTFLDRTMQTLRASFHPSSPTGTTVSRTQLTEHVRASLRAHLRHKVMEEDALCRDASAFSVCLTYVMSGQCNWEGCRQAHVDLVSLDSKQYNARVGIHLQQILILQFMYSAEPKTDRESLRYWSGQVHEALCPPFYVQGSITDFDPSLIPESWDGIRVMKHWFRDLFYSLDPDDSPKSFLTSFLRGAGLSFTFDRSEAPGYLRQVKRTTFEMFPLLFRQPEERYIVDDIICSFQGSSKASISAGVIYLHHIVERRINVNLAVLCDCIDSICASFVICLCSQSKAVPPLHNIILPRSWLLAANKSLHAKETGMMWMLFGVLKSLVDILRSDSDKGFLLLDRTRLTPILCNLFISRICRTLCFMGHNIDNRYVRMHISDIMALLDEKVTFRRPHAYYRRYAGLGPSRGGYLRAIQYYQDHWQVVINDVVHLVHKSRSSGVLRASHVPKLVYGNVEEIPGLLSKHLAAARSNLRPEAPSFVPNSTLSSQGQSQKEPSINPMQVDLEGDLPATEGDDTAAIDGEAVPTGQEVQIDRAADVDSYVHAVDEVLVQPNAPSEEETHAACVLQAIYRRRLDRRHRSVRSGLAAERHAFFEECLKRVEATEWSSSYYRFLYLGPLPHLLVCLERGITITHDTKRKIKGRLNKDTYDRIEELGKQRTELTSLRKQGERLRKALEPQALLHRSRDIEGLKGHVLEMKEFLQKLPGGAPELQQDYAIAYKGIVAVRKIAKKMKPTLNTEDDVWDV
ncbi:hypothetical protein BV22DRAFT_1063475 [Leucogyrophana mollusca]|uniref:Uncharacterized protein n=1 Tax=Leucogyrophana mollusca TaxID=85980 RepID=A0ACB8BM33_9AGAM|nr:hypothetical protein BV22DRAFT_1063475 [Leucogyrophana mollusca]